GRVGVHVAEAGLAGGPGGGEDRLRRLELGHQPVDGGARPHRPSSRACVSGSSARISEIEIIGSTRMNSRNRTKKNPMVPKKVRKSQTVGLNMPHDEGR